MNSKHTAMTYYVAVLVSAVGLSTAAADKPSKPGSVQSKKEESERRKIQTERVAKLSPQLRSQDLDERENALRLLVDPDGYGGYIPEDILPDFLRLLASDKKTDRYWAAGGLGMLEPHLAPQAIKPLVAALADEEAEVRHRVAEALGSLKAKDGIAGLSKLAVSDPDRPVRDMAGNSLLKIGGPEAHAGFIAYAETEVDGLLAIRRSADGPEIADIVQYLETIIRGATVTKSPKLIPVLKKIIHTPPSKSEYGGDLDESINKDAQQLLKTMKVEQGGAAKPANNRKSKIDK